MDPQPCAVDGVTQQGLVQWSKANLPSNGLISPINRMGIYCQLLQMFVIMKGGGGALCGIKGPGVPSLVPPY